MKKIIAVMLFVIPFFANAGFFGGDKNVDLVKNAVLPYDTTLTLGQAIETNPVCVNHKWESTKDRRGRAQVTHTCEYSDLAKDVLHYQYYKAAEKMLAGQAAFYKLNNSNLKAEINYWYESNLGKFREIKPTTVTMTSVFSITADGEIAPESFKAVAATTNPDLGVTFTFYTDPVMNGWYADVPEGNISTVFVNILSQNAYTFANKFAGIPPMNK